MSCWTRGHLTKVCRIRRNSILSTVGMSGCSISLISNKGHLGPTLGAVSAHCVLTVLGSEAMMCHTPSIRWEICNAKSAGTLAPVCLGLPRLLIMHGCLQKSMT